MIYKVMVDLNEVDLNYLFQLIGNKDIDVCIGDDNLYFYSKGSRKVPISNLMKKMNTSGFIIKSITEKPKPDTNNFVDSWCYDKMSAEEAEQFEEEHQSELHQMMENIRAVREELFKNNSKEESADETGDNEETGSSTESAD